MSDSLSAMARRAPVPLLLLALWQWVTASGWLPPGTLASPGSTLSAAWTLAVDGTLQEALGVSLRRAALGFALGGVLGLTLGLAAGFWQLGEELIDGSMQMLRTVPFVALAPLFIVWFGIDESAKIALVAFATLFPLYINTYAGIRGIDNRLLEAGRTLGLGRAALVREVVLPGALPAILVGLRYSLALSVISLVIAEQINADAGIGALLLDARRFVQTDVMALCMVIYALLGLATNAMVRLLEWRLLSWRSGVRAS
ncbi:ABC transporter permease subunit [Variovorax boronicumulans]|uniref:ABC transporter permease subunit n=1 Tax=Variovorax boronicumulans TaxID=436515 RepID=UPI001C56F929